MDHLSHYGIKGQKWGVKNGPPYPLKGGDYSPSERAAIEKKKRSLHDIYNKRHFDSTIRTSDTLRTLSYDPHRTEDAEMFYAAYTKADKHEYDALFNRVLKQPVFDEHGNQVGEGKFLKYKIDNSVASDIKVASEDSAAEVFKKLYKENRDFYNFVKDEDRMQSYFVSSKYKFKGYREARAALEKMRNDEKSLTEDDVWTIYRMFNYCIPYDGGGDASKGKDMAHQRARFFNALKAEGYGAVLDTNDAIYGGFKAESPVIVFEMASILPKSVMRTSVASKTFSQAVTFARKAFGL